MRSPRACSARARLKKLHEDVAFRVLGANNFPAHGTIREFCALHLAEFTELFTQVGRLAREMGLVKLGTIAVDGTKIKANASRHKAMSYARMQSTEVELKAQIAALMKKAANVDEAERNEPDLGHPRRDRAARPGPAQRRAALPAHAGHAGQTTNRAGQGRLQKAQMDCRAGPTAGSRTCWGSGNSVCADYIRHRPSSSPCVWH